MAKTVFGTLHPFLEGGDVYGRTVANTGFIKALFSADPFTEYHFFVTDPAALRLQLDRCAALPAVAREAVRIFSRQDLPRALCQTTYHCFHLSDPISGQADLAVLRNVLAPVLFPVTSVNHTLSYADYGLRLLPHIWPGASPRDAIGATSRAAAAVLRSYFSQLRENYALPAHWGQPELLDIPLGVDIARFRPAGLQQKIEARAELGLAADEIVCLLHGRICLDDKLDALPVLFALSRVRQAAPDLRPVLIVSGRPRANDNYPQTLEAAAKGLAVPLRLVLSPDDAELDRAFAAADIFLSPSDNIQESFGLSLLEAGAVGLPAVVSDWDGYRDLVADGMTGFCIPTLGPGQTPSLDCLAHALPDNIHQLWRAQQTVVDVAAMSHALLRLFRDPALRSSMGQAARERIVRHFSWDRVVELWLEAWDKLWQDQLSAEDEGRLRAARHPVCLDWGRLFAGHPSSLLDEDGRLGGVVTYVKTSTRGEQVRAGRQFCICWPGLEGRMDGTDWRQMLVLARRPIRLDSLLERLRPSASSSEGVRFALLWALKQDLLELVPGPDQPIP